MARRKRDVTQAVVLWLGVVCICTAIAYEWGWQHGLLWIGVLAFLAAVLLYDGGGDNET